MPEFMTPKPGARQAAPSLLLAADIGGTRSRFALFRRGPGHVPRLELKGKIAFATAEQRGFAELLGRLRDFVPPGVSRACFGVAGPAEDGFCRAPNIAWEIRAEEAADILGIPEVLLVNDFVAQGHACLLALTDGRVREALEITQIYDGFLNPQVKAVARPIAPPIALVGAGTGLGKALLLPQAGLALPSEGGHAEFPFRPEEEAFADFMRARRGEIVETEMPVSGRGLAEILSFHLGENVTPEAAAERLNPPRSEAEHAALALFARLYGRACRNYVLDAAAFGGLYITGGMAGRVPVLGHPAFLESFFDNPPMGDLLRRVPIFHMRGREAGLWGAAAYATSRAPAAVRHPIPHGPVR